VDTCANQKMKIGLLRDARINVVKSSISQNNDAGDGDARKADA
jgi:hypothetical protein